MTDFTIEYNPYLVKCVFKKNGKELTNNTKFGSKCNVRLQHLLGESDNWIGLAEEIAKNCNDKKIRLHFKGRRLDYDDLKYCIDRYRGTVNYELDFEESINDNDILGEMDKLIAEIKQKNISKFNEKNRDGKNIFDAYEEAKNGIFEVSVIATMSSGKSTLINSLLHTELLPSENKACTATIARILDNDDMDVFEAECFAADKKTIVHPRSVVDSAKLKEYNADENVQYIDIEGSVPAIPSDKIRLCLRDTPGPNNSRDENHGRLTKSIIKRTNAVVLYVMNATQIGINDDKQLLEDISAEMKRDGKQSHDRFIFVVNKCDALDEGKGETVEQLLKDVTNYLKGFGIVEPTLIPTSARLALLIRKDRKEEQLTRQEKRELNQIEDFVECEELHFEDYATLTPTVREVLRQRTEKYHSNEDDWDLEALIHTGVPALEETIREYIEKYAYPIKINDAVKDILAILEELDMANDLDKKIAGDEKELQKVKKQIEEAKQKQAQSKGIYNRTKQKIQDFSFPLDKKKELFKVERELESMTKEYSNMTKVDKSEAERLVKEFQEKLNKYQIDCESRLNREIDQRIYQYGNRLLAEYQHSILSIIDDIKIEGYDFKKISSFNQIKINNVDDIVKRNEQDRMREETRWRDNPERQGFFGFFKFWKPKQISYTVEVKDGIDVNINKVMVDIMNVFSTSIKSNLDKLFSRAETQVSEYKNSFTKNINDLEREIDRIIAKLEKDMANSETIEKRVKENRKVSEWIKDKTNEINALLYI